MPQDLSALLSAWRRATRDYDASRMPEVRGVEPRARLHIPLRPETRALGLLAYKAWRALGPDGRELAIEQSAREVVERKGVA